jgi:hypothetical protein
MPLDMANSEMQSMKRQDDREEGNVMNHVNEQLKQLLKELALKYKVFI